MTVPKIGIISASPLNWLCLVQETESETEEGGAETPRVEIILT